MSEGCDKEGDIYNPSKMPGDNVWQPAPSKIVELYEKLEKVSLLFAVIFSHWNIRKIASTNLNEGV